MARVHDLKGKLIMFSFYLLFFVIILVFIFQTMGYGDYTFVKIKINPEFSFVINGNDEVVYFIPLNSDAERIYDKDMFVNMSLENAIDVAIEVAKEHNLLSDDEKNVTLTVISDDEEKKKDYEAKTVEYVKNSDEQIVSEVVEATEDEIVAYDKINKSNINQAEDIITSVKIQRTPKKDFFAYKDLSGSTRYNTAVQISNNIYPNGTSNVVLVEGNDLIDGVLASAFASALDAPILLINNSVGTNSIVFDEISRLGAQNVYLIGGTAIVSVDVENEIRNKLSINVQRISGDNRFLTAIAIASRVNAHKTVDSVVIVPTSNEPVDAAIITSACASENMPILYSAVGSLSRETMEYLSNNPNIVNVYLVGGQFTSGTVFDDVEALGKTVKFINGTDRFETNSLIINEFNSDFNSVVLVNNFIDTIAASQLAAKTNSAYFYAVSSLSQSQSQLILNKKVTNVYYLGGDDIKTVYRDLMYKINKSHAKDIESLLFNKNKAVFYVPHQDDETLFYSQVIATAVDILGDENVFVVLFTDGAASGVQYDQSFMAALNEAGISLTAARDIEYVAALEQLGVKNIQFVNELDFITMSRFGDSTLINNIDNIKTVMKAYDTKYGSDIVHFSYTPYYDDHNDHKALGHALTQLYFDQSLPESSFSNVYFIVKSTLSCTAPADYQLLLDNNANSNNIVDACNEFKRDLSDSNNLRYGVGYRSVSAIFDGVIKNAENKTMKTVLHIPFYN